MITKNLKVPTLTKAKKLKEEASGKEVKNKKGTGGTKAAEDYKALTPHEMVLQRPETYIGSDVAEVREERVYNFETKKFCAINMNIPIACVRLLLEPLANAADNVHESRLKKVSPGKIEMWMNDKTVTIKNYGITIPIEKSVNHSEDLYIPELIFGTVFSSSNYDDRKEFKTKKKIRTGLGKNGIGIKATNIFSRRFQVVIHNSIMKLSYTQEWTNNMFNRKDPIIEEYLGSESSTCISYDMDFDYFSLPYQEYSYEMKALYCRHLLDISFTAKVPVSFNDVEYDLCDIKDFAKLCFDDDIINTAITHIQWPEDSDPKDRKKYKFCIPSVEMMLIDDPNNGSQYTFANCIATVAGVHIETAFKSIASSFIEKINEPVLKDLAAKYKGVEIPLKEKKACTLTLADVKKHVSMILSVQVLSPLFGSQLKDDLKGPVPNITVKPSLLKNIENWKLIDHLKNNLDAKIDKIFEKETKSRKGKLTKGIHANLHGTSQRDKCFIILTEGSSGANYVSFMFANDPGLRDYFGVLPLKGKTINSINHSAMKVKNNMEIKEITTMLGLVAGTDYSIDENFNKLNYAGVIGLFDSDYDNYHISGLVYIFFHQFYPSLLKRDGFFKYTRTPILRAYKGKEVLKFYTLFEYKDWSAKAPGGIKSWKLHYFKGLGTSTKENVKDDMESFRQTVFLHDELADNRIQLAFNKKYADDRKVWIDNYIPNPKVALLTREPISTFIDYELIEFSLEDIRRSIPHMIDGLKESQRKIIYASYHTPKWSMGGKSELMKVAQFACHVANVSNYLHGEVSLQEAVVSMGQKYCGSNNIPLFFDGGGFGTREKAGKDHAAARYIFCRPNPLFSYIFRNEDVPILEYTEDEGETFEPKYYLPILPFALINQEIGIATSVSTFIPSCDPLVLCNYIRKRLNDQNDSLPTIMPWYRGFNGTIKLVDRTRENKPQVVNIVGNQVVGSEDIEDTDLEKYNKAIDESEISVEKDEESEDDKPTIIEKEPLLPQYSMLSYGNYAIQEDNSIIVTEMPLFRSPDSYRKWLEELRDQKVISHFFDYTADDIILFKIFGFTKSINHINLRLVTRKSLTNMTLLNLNGKPVKFDSFQDIIEDFIEQRLDGYHKRKAYVLNKMQLEIDDKDYRMRFIQNYIDKKLLIENQADDFIFQQLDKLKIPREYLDKIHLRHCTKASIEKLAKEIAERNKALTDYRNTPIEDIWLNELDEFEKVYHKEFPNVYEITTPDINMVNKKKARKPRAITKPKEVPRGTKVKRAPRK